MVRFRKYGRLDSIPVSAGDNVFIGIDTLTDPKDLADGYLSDGRNIRIRGGDISGRSGSVVTPWTNTVDPVSETSTLWGNQRSIEGSPRPNDPVAASWEASAIIGRGDVIYNNVVRTPVATTHGSWINNANPSVPVELVGTIEGPPSRKAFKFTNSNGGEVHQADDAAIGGLTFKIYGWIRAEEDYSDLTSLSIGLHFRGLESGQSEGVYAQLTSSSDWSQWHYFQGVEITSPSWAVQARASVAFEIAVSSTQQINYFVADLIIADPNPGPPLPVNGDPGTDGSAKEYLRIRTENDTIPSPPDDDWNYKNPNPPWRVVESPINSLGKVYGVGVTGDARNQRIFLCAGEENAWVIRAGSFAERIPYPDGVKISGKSRLIQFGSSIFLFSKARILEANLYELTEFVEPEIEIPESSQLKPIIPTDLAIEYRNRIWFVFDYIYVGSTDVADPLRYHPTESVFLVGRRDGDCIMGLFPLQGDRLVIFKERSIWILSGISGTSVTDNERLDLLTDQVGCVSHDTIVSVGGNHVLFLDRQGVFRLSDILENRLGATPLPISYPIESYFEQINWMAARNSYAIYYDNRYHLSVPFGDSVENNRVFIFQLFDNQGNGAWESIDVLPNGIFYPRWFVDIPFGLKANNLCAVAERGYVSLYDYELSGVDESDSGIHLPVEALAVSRSYRPRSIDRSRIFHGLDLTIDKSTWGPRFTITALSIGHMESRDVVVSETYDRTKYRIAKPDYKLDNSGDDFGEAYREDYSIFASDGAILGEHGFLMILARYSETYPLNASDHALRVSIENSGGVFVLHEIELLASHQTDTEVA